MYIPNSDKDYKPILDTIYKGYAEALAFLHNLMNAYDVKSLVLKYQWSSCYNVNVIYGGTDRILEIRLTDDNDLIAIGEEGTEYPLGNNIDGQDNYILCGLGALLEAALASAKQYAADNQKKVFLAKGIEYETDGEEVELPKDLQIVADDEDSVVDRISDITGWLVSSVKSIEQLP